KNRPNSCAPNNTARYPAIFDCDDNASIDCAREIRGTASNAKPDTPDPANARTPPAFVSGCKKPINTPPLPSRATSPTLAGATSVTTSQAQPTPAPSVTDAPASAN